MGFFQILIISGLSRGENDVRILPALGCRFFRARNPHQLPPRQAWGWPGLIPAATETPQCVPGVTPATTTHRFPAASQPVTDAPSAPPDVAFPCRTLGNSEPAWGLALHAGSVPLPAAGPRQAPRLRPALAWEVVPGLQLLRPVGARTGQEPNHQLSHLGGENAEPVRQLPG